jgi:post-segregation antitoxin (ccd killing protein)
MANQRDQNKRGVGAWIPAQLKGRLEAIAKDRGVPLSELVEEALAEMVDQADSGKWKVRERRDKSG